MLLRLLMRLWLELHYWRKHFFGALLRFVAVEMVEFDVVLLKETVESTEIPHFEMKELWYPVS